MSGRWKGTRRNNLDDLLRRFGGNFRAARIKAGFESQSAFSRATGIDQSYVSRVERGDIMLTVAGLVKMANLVDADVVEMMEREPPERESGPAGED